MAEWLFEAGLGEDRAILVHDGKIIEARIELPGLRAGTVADGQLTRIMAAGRRGVATLHSGEEVTVEPLPRELTEGAALRVQIVRELGMEAGAVKRAKARVSDAPLVGGPALCERIGAHQRLDTHGPDVLEQAGWTECLEHATRGIVPFPGGALRISLTPAMTLIDVDGDLAPNDLACTGASAAGAAIRCFDISGNIGIDLPTVAGKSERATVAEALDAVLPQPFERTAVNGFGFLQIIRPKLRNSLSELLASDPVGAAIRSLFRKAERSRIVGPVRLVVPKSMAAALANGHVGNMDALARTLGGEISVRIVDGLSLHGALVEAR